MVYFEGRELERVRMLVREINDLMSAIEKEANLDRAYKGYLCEKVDGVYTDVKCLRSMLLEEN